MQGPTHPQDPTTTLPEDGCTMDDFPKNHTACNLLSRQGLERLNSLARGSTCCLITVEAGDFFDLVSLSGEEAGFALLETILEETKKQIPQHFQGAEIMLAEQAGLSCYLLLLALPEYNPVAFFNTYPSFRFTIQEHINDGLTNTLGRHAMVLIGASLIKREGNNGMDRALLKALCEAQRLARIKTDSEHFTLHRDFRTIVNQEQVDIVFQPIFNFTNGDIHGWEAFTRGPEASPFHDPEMLFGFAQQANEVLALEKLCHRKAIRNFGPAVQGKRLFLNVHPMSLCAEECIFEHAAKLLNAMELSPDNVVFEFSEKLNQHNSDLLVRKLDVCRNHNFSVAVDDVGAGFSSLQLLSLIRPDFIKADISLVHGIDVNPLKRTIVETLVLLADKFGGRVVAEGVESETEFSSLVSMGVQAGQGHLFALPANPRPHKRIDIPAKASYQEVSGGELKCLTPIGDITQETLVVDQDTLVRRIKEVEGDRPPMSSMVIVDREKRPMGLLMNYNLDKRLGTKFGISLYYDRPVYRIMDPNPLRVDVSQPIEDVARAAMNRDNEKIYDDIIVVENGIMIGTVSVQKMLDTLTQVQVELAKGSNPLTGLPGNVAIEQEIERRMRHKIPSSIMYLDLDNFKIYNDKYGFSNGDKVIVFTAGAIKEATTREGGQDDFVGHIGGDDFIIITDSSRAEPIGQAVAASMETHIPEYYSEEDQKAGFIEATGRDGKVGHFPLVTVSIGILDVEFQRPFALKELGHRAAEVKKFAKTKPGNSIVRDRRAPLGAEEA
ncbi:MAG: GGDEF domain-containing protein [Desulfovibrio sp.]|nr:MAG: GGDEF domain-containing protein [Desulfovibrio sp.]